jgi:predicted kinase
MKLKYCHLIGGAPLSGKTTLAEKLAVKTGAVQFSTDNIRDWMRQVATESEYPSLFEDIKLHVERYYEK